jgi:hypothetical protein
MIDRVGVFLATAVLLATLLTAPTNADATGCSTNAECDPGGACVVTWNFFFFQLKECQAAACNTDNDCTGGTLCLLGLCRSGCRTELDCPASRVCLRSECVAPSQQPGAGTIPGEGRKCNPPDGSRPPGWATDPHGKPLGACPQGTLCTGRGFCAQPPR